MSVEENKRLVERYFEGFNTGKTEGAEQFIAEEFTHFAADGLPVPLGPEGYRQTVKSTRSSLPDAQYLLESMIGEGEWVATRYHGDGTQRGEYLGVPATRRQVEVTGMAFFRIVDGKIRGLWLEENTLEQLQQMEAVELHCQLPKAVRAA